MTEQKQPLDQLVFEFASRPAKGMTGGQKVLQGLTILAMMGGFAVLFAIASVAGGALLVVAWPLLAVAAIVLVVVQLARAATGRKPLKIKG